VDGRGTSQRSDTSKNGPFSTAKRKNPPNSTRVVLCSKATMTPACNLFFQNNQRQTALSFPLFLDFLNVFVFLCFINKNDNGRNEWLMGVHLHSKSTGQADATKGIQGH